MNSADAVPVGVLALQGDFAAHGRVLDRLGQPWIEVRKPAQLEEVSGLILPGAESTTLLKLMAAVAFETAIRALHASGRPLFGTCAGVIVLARTVSHPAQPSLGLLDVDVDRNAYGRQVDSFETAGMLYRDGGVRDEPIEMVFIRAPRITRVGRGVVVLARHGDEPVLVQGPGVLGATFHPELGRSLKVHQLFLAMCRRGGVALAP